MQNVKKPPHDMLTLEDLQLLADAEHTRQLLLERMARDEEERLRKLRRKAGYRD